MAVRSRDRSYSAIFSWISAQVSRVFAFPKEQPLCTQDSPCLVCKDWLPEAQGRRCGEGGEESQRTWSHGRLRRNLRSGRYASIPLQAFQQWRVVQSQTNQDKSHEFLGPRNRSPWFLRWNGPALTGRTAVASRSADRKRRHRADNRQDSPRHQSSRRREDERSCPSYSDGSSSRKRAESGSVSKASDTRPSASSSEHHCQRRQTVVLGIGFKSKIDSRFTLSIN